MANVLVCIKRVPDFSGEVLLTEDAQSADARFVGYTLSNHDSCAVELAVQVAIGDRRERRPCSRSVTRTRSSSSARRSASAAPPPSWSRPTRSPWDRPTSPHEIAAVVRDHEARRHGRTTWCCWATTPPTPATSRWGSGSPTSWPAGGHRACRPSRSTTATARLQGDGPDGRETYEVPLPAVVTVMEGGVEPRYPTITGRMKAKKVEIETRPAPREPAGSGRVRLTLPPPSPSTVEVLGEGPEAAGAVVDLLQRLGVGR